MKYQLDPNVFALLVVCIFLIGLIIFILIRELNCWYWKVNKRIVQIQNIDDNLQFIVDFIKERQELERRQFPQNSEKSPQ